MKRKKSFIRMTDDEQFMRMIHLRTSCRGPKKCNVRCKTSALREHSLTAGTTLKPLILNKLTKVPKSKCLLVPDVVSTISVLFLRHPALLGRSACQTSAQIQARPRTGSVRGAIGRSLALQRTLHFQGSEGCSSVG